MPIVNIIRRASNYILGSEELQDKNDTLFEDNEVLFCKNNVCVHPPALVRQESDILHYPGYLTVTTKTFTDQYNNAKRPTLLLTWIPNATLRKCPSTVENYGITSSLLGNGAATTTNHTLQCDSIHSYTDELKQHKLYNQISDWNGSLNDKNDGNTQQTCLDSTTAAMATAAGVPIHHTNPFLDPYLYENEKMANNRVESMDTISVSSNSDRASSSGVHSTYGGDTDPHQNDEDVFCTDNLKKSMPNVAEEEDSEEVKQLKRELEPLIETDGDNKAIVIINATKQNVKSLLAQPKNPPLLTSVNITIANPHIQNQDLSPEELMIEQQQQNAKLMRTQSVNSVEETGTSNWMTPELLAFKHNLAFPDSVTSSPILTRNVPMKCRRFSVDLSQMRSLRLFFNDENCTSGQLVIASRESQYKILHFHHGGLDHLAQVLHQWHCLLHNIKLAPNGGVGGGVVGLNSQDEPNLPYRQFMVCRPEVKKCELHPDEGNVNKITTDYFYGTLLNEKGQIEDDLLLRKCVFFGGLEKSLRKAVWPFLLHCYSFNSTFEDRALLMDIRQQVRIHVALLAFIVRINFGSNQFSLWCAIIDCNLNNFPSGIQ